MGWAGLRPASVGPFRRTSVPGGRTADATEKTGNYCPKTQSNPVVQRYAAARPPFASCHGVKIRGPPAVIAIVNSKWAASDPSWE